MKKLIWLSLSVLLLQMHVLHAQTKRNIDTDAAQISFDFVTDKTTGTIGELQLKIHYDPTDLSTASFSGTAAVESIDTGNFLRDGHLMWQKFFYKKKYPTLTFTSTKVIPVTDTRFTVYGNMVIKGIRKEIQIDFEAQNTQLLGTTTLYTSDFDIHIHEPRDQNQLKITFRFPFQ